MKQYGGYSFPDDATPSEMRQFVGSQPRGSALVPGNIDLAHRPVVRNADGSVSTVRSISIGQDGRTVLIPTVSPDGRIMTNPEAVAEYRRTGKHLGIFGNQASADSAAEAIHNQQASLYTGAPPPEVAAAFHDFLTPTNVGAALATLAVPPALPAEALMSLATLRGVGTAAGLGAGGGMAGNVVGRLTAHGPLPSLPELGQSALQGAELGASGELLNRGLVMPAARRVSGMSLPRYRVPQGASSAAAVKVAEVNRQLPITQLTERIPSGEPGLVPAASRESEIAAHRDALLDRVGSQVDKTDVIREISRLSFNKQAKNEAKQLVDEIFDAHYAAGGGPSMGGVAAGGEKSDLYAKAGFQAGRIRDPQVAARIASRGFRQAIEKSVPPGADRRALVALNQRLGRIKSLSKAVGASYNRGGAKLVPGLAAGAAEGIGLRRGLPLGSSLEYAALAATLARLGLSPAVESRAALMAAHPVSQALSRALPAGLAAAVTATRPRQAASADTARAGQSSQADLRRHLYQDKPLQASVPDPEEAGAGFAAQVMDEYGSQLSKFQARQLLRMHRASYADFVRELGDKAVYGTQKVLGWLGY